MPRNIIIFVPFLKPFLTLSFSPAPLFWYIKAVQRFGWSKLALKKIAAKANLEISLDLTCAVCYTEENHTAKEASVNAASKDTQLRRIGNAGSGNWPSPLFRLSCSELLHRRISPDPLLVRRRRGWPTGVAHGIGPPGRGGLRLIR